MIVDRDLQPFQVARRPAGRRFESEILPALIDQQHRTARRLHHLGRQRDDAHKQLVQKDNRIERADDLIQPGQASGIANRQGR